MPTVEKQRFRQRTRSLFRGVISRELKRPEKLIVSQWAEKYRILDESSNFKGKWSNDITPYLIGIMDAFNDPYIQEINFCKPTQVGGTEAMINMLGWIIMDDPAPTMIVYPSDDLAKDVSNDRLKPSLMKTPEIAERFYRNASKELNMKFRGMNIKLRGSGSPGKLSSFPIKYLFFDEIDKMDGASKREASPYNLARERTRTYTYSKKIYTCSTPTLKTNYVWQIHEDADEQLNYFVPCPHCGEHIVLRFSQIIYSDDKALSNSDRAKTSSYACQECGCFITDKDKISMLRKGEWRVVQKKGLGKARKVSFWLNALYSRFLTWADIALEFMDSKDEPEKLQNFINSWLAEPWEDTKLKTTEDLVMERQTETPELIAPKWARLLTAGVDVQESSFYYTVRAWGDRLTSQNVAHGQVSSFYDIETIMNAEWETEDGRMLLVDLALIDSGYQADATYDFCVDHSEWAAPCKGASNSLEVPYKRGKIDRINSRAYGMDLIIIDGNKYKDMIAGRMRRQNGEGSWMVYKGCDLTYAKQVTSEHKVNVKAKNGKVQQRWVEKTSHADNHYLDAEVYAFAAADIRQVRYLHMESETEPAKKPAVSAQQEENWIAQNDSWL